MEEPAARSGSNIIVTVLAGQLVVGAVLAAVFWGLAGGVAGYSAGARALLRAAYAGELGKLGLTVLMFSIVFVMVRPLAPGALFAGFIAAQLVTFAGFLMRDAEQVELDTDNKNGE
jgi:ATP synthase protein I